MDDIQLQFKVNGTIRSAIINVPSTYGELENEIRKQTSRVKAIEFSIMYENHDGEHVVLNRDPRSLRIAIASSAIIPGTDLKRLKVEIFEGSSPSVRKEKTQEARVSTAYNVSCKSPLKKRLCPAVDKRFLCVDNKSNNSTTQYCRKSLTFSSKAKRDNFASDVDQVYNSDEELPAENPVAHVDEDRPYFDEGTTPFQRYVKRTEEQIRLKENNLRKVQNKAAEFQERLEVLKSQYGNVGKMCHNCHLRLGHTSRNCTFDSCTSLFECGQEKLHPGENVGKQYTCSINKLTTELEQLRRDLDSKLKASQKVKTSINHNIEQQLLEENNDNYYEGGIKNWTLLRKHVYALQSYCKKSMNGKIPPRHQLMETLDEALEECQENTRSVYNQARPRKHRSFTSKDLLEKHGVEFPKKTHSTEQCSDETDCFPSNTPVSADFSRLLPENEFEEAEQLNICIRESIRTNSNRGQVGQRQFSPANNASNDLIMNEGTTCIPKKSSYYPICNPTTSISTSTISSNAQMKPKSTSDCPIGIPTPSISTSTMSMSSNTQKSAPPPDGEVGEQTSDTQSAAELLLSLANIH